MINLITVTVSDNSSLFYMINDWIRTKVVDKYGCRNNKTSLYLNFMTEHNMTYHSPWENVILPGKMIAYGKHLRYQMN